MFYTVEQSAIKLKVSRATVYNKIKLDQFKDKVIMMQGQTMLTDDLINLIQDNLKGRFDLNVDENIEPQEFITKEQKADTISLDENYVKLNKEYINTLLEQLHKKDSQMEEKDLQIHEKDNQIIGLHKLIENSQVLLKEKPQQDIQLLEEHFQDLDSKLMDIREQMGEQEPKSQDHKGFFNKLFKH